MYVIDKPLYAIQLPNGNLAEDLWSGDFQIFVTFSRSHAEEQLPNLKNAKVVLYSDYIKRGDDFPVHGGQPLPEDLL